MNIIIPIYILLCLLLLVFDICFLLVQRRRNLVAYRTNSSFEKEVLQEMAKHREEGSFSANFANDLHSKLSRTQNLLTLQGVVENDKEAKEWFRPYVFEQIDNYASLDSSQQAYYTYVLSTFDYSNEKPAAEYMDKALKFLDSKSLYTFTNTMMFLYAVGETVPLMRAMDKIDERSGFYHKKLLVDGLISIQAEGNEFNEKLVEKFDSYTPYTQDCLLDYFRLSGYDASALCMRLLRNNETDTQVVYSAMRYFAKYPNEESRAYFLEVLADENASWVAQLLAVQALRRYYDDEVQSAIFKKLSSPNWHIRVNAVDYMHSTGVGKNEIFDILYQRDRYTNEALLYQYRNDKEMTRYIIDTVHMLKLQDEALGISDDTEADYTIAPAARV